MGDAPIRRCLHPGCPVRGAFSRCPAHVRTFDRSRGTARERGYTPRWDRYALGFLARHPLCGDRPRGAPGLPNSRCATAGRIRAAEAVDHRTPHAGNYALMWDPLNHEALCRDCHAWKTATLDRARLAREDR